MGQVALTGIPDLSLLAAQNHTPAALSLQARIAAVLLVGRCRRRELTSHTSQKCGVSERITGNKGTIKKLHNLLIMKVIVLIIKNLELDAGENPSSSAIFLAFPPGDSPLAFFRLIVIYGVESGEGL